MGRREVAGEGNGPAIEHDRSRPPALSLLDDAEIVERGDIAWLQRQGGAVALGRLVEPSGDPQRFTQIVVIGRHRVVICDCGLRSD